MSIYVDLVAMTRERKPSTQAAALLTALLEQPKTWRHGYDLSIHTRLKSGTLYPLLMRLSDRGLLHSRWEPAEMPGRPPRHMYRLTAQGVAYAREQLAAIVAQSRVGTTVGVRA
jgi:PadR family transcriptional regulator, regulatory protein PadR